MNRTTNQRAMSDAEEDSDIDYESGEEDKEGNKFEKQYAEVV